MIYLFLFSFCVIVCFRPCLFILPFIPSFSSSLLSHVLATCLHQSYSEEPWPSYCPLTFNSRIENLGWIFYLFVFFFNQNSRRRRALFLDSSEKVQLWFWIRLRIWSASWALHMKPQFERYYFRASGLGASEFSAHLSEHRADRVVSVSLLFIYLLCKPKCRLFMQSIGSTCSDLGFGALATCNTAAFSWTSDTLSARTSSSIVIQHRHSAGRELACLWPVPNQSSKKRGGGGVSLYVDNVISTR